MHHIIRLKPMRLIELTAAQVGVWRYILIAVFGVIFAARGEIIGILNVTSIGYII